MLHPYSIPPPPPPGLFFGGGGGGGSVAGSEASSTHSRSEHMATHAAQQALRVRAASSSSGGSGGDFLGMGSGMSSGFDAPFAAASAFLSSIQLRVDPSVPPPPLYPSVSFHEALAALASVPPAEWAHWASMRQAASEAFLAHIPLGHESADQRPQPPLHLPQGVLEQRPTSTGAGGLAAATDHLPAFQPAFSAASSKSSAAADVGAGLSGSALVNPSLQHQLSGLGGSLTAPAAMHAGAGAGLGLDGSAAIPPSGELLLYAAGDGNDPATGPPSPHDALAPPLPPPLRLQTPPPLMGMGAVSGGSAGSGGSATASATPVVGAHLFGNPLLFPATLSAPLDLSRSTTEQLSMLHAQHAAAQRLARPLLPGRSVSEFPQAMALNMSLLSSTAVPYGSQAGMLPPFTSPVISAQHSSKSSNLNLAGAGGAGGDGGGRAGGAAGTGSSSGSSAGSGGAMGGSPGGDGEGGLSAQGKSDDLLAGGVRAVADRDHADADQQLSSHPKQQQHQSASPPAFLRPDGTAHGLRDSRAQFVSSPRAAGVSTEAWERDLLDKGILDARVVLTPQSLAHTLTQIARDISSPPGAVSPRNNKQQRSKGLSGMGGPMFVSSLQPFVPRADVSSNPSTAPHTPHLGAATGLALAGRSRVGSFSLEPNAVPGLAGAAAVGGGLPGFGLLGSGGLDGSGEADERELDEDTGLAPLQNPMLSLIAATLSAEHAQELEDAGGDRELLAEHQREGVSWFGKRQGTSFAYLLPPRPKRKGQASGGKGSSGNDGDNKRDSEHAAGNGGKSSSSSALALAGVGGGGAGAGGVSSPSEADVSLLSSSNDLYSPDLLDDPALKSGKHRVVLQLAGFMSSLATYVRSKELRSELNVAFAARHRSWLSPVAQFSLSKLLKCKQLLLDLVVRLDLELATLAVAYIYLEKLVLLRQVHKGNRKLVAAVCLLLAFKWSEGSAGAARAKKLAALFAGLEKSLHASRAAITRAEFDVFAALGFDLTVKTEHVLHHFRQALAKLDTVPQDYRHIEWSL